MTRPRSLLVALAVFHLAGGAGLAIADSTPAPACRQLPGAGGCFQAQRPRIQIAILLDTSNSMDGLIDQARNQLWQVVDAFSTAKRDGMPPILEVAVLEYGNSRLSGAAGYTRQVAKLTTDLDRVSEALFALTTNGGEEYCGYAIDVATRTLDWSKSPNDIRAIFIAGNEPFTQGPVSYVKAIQAAKQRGITVNTIHAGPYDVGLQTQWQAGAQLAGGKFMSIDQDVQTVHVEAPQDKRLAELNTKLNETYVPFGPEGEQAKERQVAQDANSAGISSALLAKRAKTKASGYYDSSTWDLVDAVKQGKVKLEEVKPAALPEPLRTLAPEARAAAIDAKAKERKDTQDEIQRLSAERDTYVAGKRAEAAQDDAQVLESALVDAVIAQGKEKSFTFEETSPVAPEAPKP